MAPSFPSERKRVKSAEDRSPDLRLLQPPSQSRGRERHTSPVVVGSFRIARNFPWLNSCFLPSSNSTGAKAEALTVAGQWRSFTAFPSILAIAVVKALPKTIRQPCLMETTSMTSTVIVGPVEPSQSPAGERYKSMVTPGRFELPTCGLGNRCSIHLSYGATFL